MDEAAVQAQIARAQEVANQAYDKTQKHEHEIQGLTGRMQTLEQDVGFAKKIFLDLNETVKTLGNSVVEMKVLSATNSNEVKNMGLMINRLESTLNGFMAGMDTKLAPIAKFKNVSEGSIKTWMIVGGIALVALQCAIAFFSR